MKPGPPELLLKASKPLLAAKPPMPLPTAPAPGSCWDCWGKGGGEKSGAAGGEAKSCCWKLGPPELLLKASKPLLAGAGFGTRVGTSALLVVEPTNANGSSLKPPIGAAVGRLKGECFCSGFSGDAIGDPASAMAAGGRPAGCGIDEVGGFMIAPMLGRFKLLLLLPFLGVTAGETAGATAGATPTPTFTALAGGEKGPTFASFDPENPKSSRSM